ncbi:MAG: hypothetical protein H8E41_02765 [Desulfobulbaceae bacterium]|uniref:Uncharacterized protein n=1 Tax=Candidatus Desulfobia pelagia TaxID=2841692 RepID=A0A8J6NDN7_9BACT|nr:hypothetical protein [Candidatus Desulfobia pelagia]
MKGIPMMTNVSMLKKWICTAAVFVVFVFLSGKPADAADLVSGSYTSFSGNSIVLSIDIQSPPPASLIIEQYLPPGTEIVGSEPKLKKYNIKKGEAKWLLKDVRPGKMTVKLQLAGKIAKGDVRALLRCMDPATGKFVEKNVTP